ncbi:MAG: 3-isopropylmalate dehydrogenase [Lachnospiraceae bacterium]
MAHKMLQWHPAFQAALQIELEEDAEYLQFSREYNLTEKPLQIDTLIIKIQPGIKIKKSIGRMFRTYNIIEYKSPGDYIIINDFYRVIAYACVYQSNTERIMEVRPEEITLTFVSNHFPKKLIHHLKERYSGVVSNQALGIYMITGLMFPLQIVISEELPYREYIWLSRLRMNLQAEQDIEPLAQAYKGKEKIPIYEAVMDIIIRANRNQYEEGRLMCEALRELFADELLEREAIGIEAGTAQGMEKGVAEGMAKAIIRLLRRMGPIPHEVHDMILTQQDQDNLNKWFDLAVESDSIQTFIQQIEISGAHMRSEALITMPIKELF